MITVLSNNLWAWVWHSPSHRREQAQLCPINCRLEWHSPRCRSGQDAVQLFFLRCLHSERSGHRFLLFPRITTSCPLPRELPLPLVLPLYIISSLAVDVAAVRLHVSSQPTWPQLCACLVFCLLCLFLYPPSPPVRFLGQACAGCKSAIKHDSQVVSLEF
jgi:hypothetical protein